MTSEELLPDLRLIVPATDRGTMAALATVTPAVDQLSVETLGSVPPPGQTLINPKAVWPPVLVTVTFKETAYSGESFTFTRIYQRITPAPSPAG